MTGVEAAGALERLADLVGRLKPLRRDPEAFFLQRSEIEFELRDIASKLADRPQQLKRARAAFKAGIIAPKGRMIPVRVRRSRAGIGRSEERPSSTGYAAAEAAFFSK